MASRKAGNGIDALSTAMGKGFTAQSRRFTKIEKRLSSIEERLDGVEEEQRRFREAFLGMAQGLVSAFQVEKNA